MRESEILNPDEVIVYPIVTEVTSRLIETENKLVFAVNIKANKKDIKLAVEELYQVRVENVNTNITCNGEKKAFVRLNPENSATDVAIRLGIL